MLESFHSINLHKFSICVHETVLLYIIFFQEQNLSFFVPKVLGVQHR